MKSRLLVSYGSAVELGLIRGSLDARPTTMYFLAKDKRCGGHCAFCAQANGAMDTRISRVDWPSFPIADIGRRISPPNTFRRICLQCTDEETVREDLPKLVKEFRSGAGVPISVSTSPIGSDLISDLKEAGTDILTIPIDCAKKSLFPVIKGRPMDDYWRSLGKALKCFGKGKVATHIIVGLGETEKEVVDLMEGLLGIGVIPSLFAFTPVRGTAMGHVAQPDILTYRRLQLARYLLVSGIAKKKGFEFDGENGMIRRYMVPREVLSRAVTQGQMFMTAGCPDCNRPYFNERVSGPIFNYPFMPEHSVLSRLCGDLVGLAEGY